jgi:hypothetical protein
MQAVDRFYVEDADPRVGAMGERALWAAVLAQAVRDLQLQSTKAEARRVRKQTARWVDATVDGPGSFVWCCECLSISPAWARARLAANGAIAATLAIAAA